MAYPQTWEGKTGRAEPVAEPQSQPAATEAQSPFTDAKATHEFWRLVNTGMDPDQAAQIVRVSLYGVKHDWEDAGGDTGTPWEKGLSETADYGERVNQYWQWEPFRDPNAPDPNRPYHPDPEHLKANFGVDVGDGKAYWVEKPTDSPFAPGVLNAQGERAGGQTASSATAAPVTPASAAAPASTTAPPEWGGAEPFAVPVPELTVTPFEAPSYEEAMASPGFQFRLGEGQKALERSAAARGTLRTGGTLKDILNYGQEAAATEYQDVYNRALQEWEANLKGTEAAFAPQYGAWQTQQAANLSKWNTEYGGNLSKWTTEQAANLAKWETEYGGNLSKWTTEYGGNLEKYLNKENNIYNLINTPAPTYPTWS